MYDIIWQTIGYIGQAVFGARFFLQWIVSEKKKTSVIPVGFWYLSILGSVMLLSYAIYRKDPVFILGQAPNVLVYLRNLQLINRNKQVTEEISSN